MAEAESRMTAPRSDALNYDWTKARRDFVSGVYPAVIAIRLGLSECDVWDRAQAEKWGGVYVRPAAEGVAA